MHESLAVCAGCLMQLGEAATHYEEAIAVYREQVTC